MDQVQERLRLRLRKARRYYLMGKAQFAAGEHLRAVSTLALASAYDPQNVAYQTLARTVRTQTRAVSSRRLVAAGVSAEGLGNWREAQASYAEAIALGSTDARAYFRLSVLARRHGGDLRGSLGYLREAVRLQPKNVAYRGALAGLYDELGFPVNAEGQRARMRRLEACAERAAA